MKVILANVEGEQEVRVSLVCGLDVQHPLLQRGLAWTLLHALQHANRQRPHHIVLHIRCS